MALAYTNNVPQATDRIKDTQQPILVNFASIQTLIDVDHVDFANNDFGKHNKVTFPVQAMTPVIAYPDIGLYSALNATTGLNELYFRNSGNVPSDVPFTASSFTSPGWAIWPCGLMVKWGQTGAIGVGGTLQFVIPSGTASTGPAFAFGPGLQGILHVQLTPLSGAANNVGVVFIGTTAVSNQISVGSFTGAIGAAYFVIGFANAY